MSLEFWNGGAKKFAYLPGPGYVGLGSTAIKIFHCLPQHHDSSQHHGIQNLQGWVSAWMSSPSPAFYRLGLIQPSSWICCPISTMCSYFLPILSSALFCLSEFLAFLVIYVIVKKCKKRETINVCIYLLCLNKGTNILHVIFFWTIFLAWSYQ